MKLLSLKATLLAFGLTPAVAGYSAEADAKGKNSDADKAASDYPSPPAVLPGKGLAQHDFLYTGEWDTRKTNATLFLIKGGKVVWSYQIPRKDEKNGQESEFSDMHMLQSGDIVFAYKTGWRKINQAKETLYDYRCPRTDQGWNECHSAQPIGPDKVLFMEN